MTIDGDSLVNELVPFANEKERERYDAHLEAAMSSLKAQVA